MKSTVIARILAIGCFATGVSFFTEGLIGSRKYNFTRTSLHDLLYYLTFSVLTVACGMILVLLADIRDRMDE